MALSTTAKYSTIQSRTMTAAVEKNAVNSLQARTKTAAKYNHVTPKLDTGSSVLAAQRKKEAKNYGKCLGI